MTSMICAKSRVKRIVENVYIYNIIKMTQLVLLLLIVSVLTIDPTFDFVDQSGIYIINIL